MTNRTAYQARNKLPWGRRKRPPEDPQTRFVKRSDGLFQVVSQLFCKQLTSVTEVSS